MPFLSELRGRPIFDANGQRFGAFQDVIVAEDQPYPPVATVIVRSARGPLAVPWDQIASIAPNGVSLRSRADTSLFGVPNADPRAPTVLFPVTRAQRSQVPQRTPFAKSGEGFALG